MPRIRADLWCAAFARRHNDLGNICVIARKGDASAGQIWVEVDHLDGTRSLFTPALAMDVEDRASSRTFEARFRKETPQKVRERIEREIEFDPDLWLVALEMRGDDHGLDLAQKG